MYVTKNHCRQLPLIGGFCVKNVLRGFLCSFFRDVAQKELGAEAKLGLNCVGGSAATAVMKLLGLVH
jgi:hypothetical protein